MSTEEAADKGADGQEIRPSRMTVREKQASYLVAGLLAVVGIAAGAAASNGLFILLGVVGGGVMAAVSARYGNRIVTAIVALLVGVLFGSAGLVLLGYGGYLMFRTSRAQAKLNASRPRMTPEQRRKARQARKEARAAEKAGATGATGTTGARPPTPAKRPTASPRYTPPKAKSSRRRS